MDSQPPTEYGPWVRGNTGEIGRVVTTYVPTDPLPALPAGSWMPVADWEAHPDPSKLRGVVREAPHG